MEVTSQMGETLYECVCDQLGLRLHIAKNSVWFVVSDFLQMHSSCGSFADQITTALLTVYFPTQEKNTGPAGDHGLDNRQARSMRTRGRGHALQLTCTEWAVCWAGIADQVVNTVFAQHLDVARELAAIARARRVRSSSRICTGPPSKFSATVCLWFALQGA